MHMFGATQHPLGQVLSACLSCLVALAGPVTELLCLAGCDEAADHALFFQPSFHASSSSEEPSLAALTQVMDLHSAHPKVLRLKGSIKRVI